MVDIPWNLTNPNQTESLKIKKPLSYRYNHFFLFNLGEEFIKSSFSW